MTGHRLRRHGRETRLPATHRPKPIGSARPSVPGQLRRVRRIENCELVSIEAHQAVERAEPEVTILSLRDGGGRVLRQTILGPPGARAALKSVRTIPNPRTEDRRPKETRRPKSKLIATAAEQQPIEPGHSRNSELPQIAQMGADNQAGRQAGRLRHCLFPICEYLRHLRLRNSGFGLRS